MVVFFRGGQSQDLISPKQVRASLVCVVAVKTQSQGNARDQAHLFHGRPPLRALADCRRKKGIHTNNKTREACDQARVIRCLCGVFVSVALS